MTCIADAADIVRRPSWIAAQCLHVGLSVATLILSLKFILTLKRSTVLNASALILLLLFTAFANLHAIVVIRIEVYEMINNAVHTDACGLTVKTSTCTILNHIVLFSIVGMVLSQHTLWLDRLAATVMATLYRRYSKTIAVFLCFITVIASFVLPFIILRNNQHSNAVLTCLIIPARSITNANLLFYSFIVLGMLPIIANFCLLIINRYKQQASRFNVTHRFEAYENVLLTKWTGLMATVQFVFMTFYSLAVFLIHTRGHNLPYVTKQLLKIWFYLVPFSTLSVPVISLLVIRRSAQNRMASINRMTSEKSDHMTNLIKMWS